MCLCGHNESPDCIVCSDCVQGWLAVMLEGKIEEAINLAVEKGMEDKAQYLNNIKQEMEEDGRESKRPIRRVSNRGAGVRVSKADKGKFRHTSPKRSTAIRAGEHAQSSLFGN